MTENITNEKYNYLSSQEKIFNPERKELFISDMVNDGHISENTIKSYERVLTLPCIFETGLNKDFCEFELEEMEKVFVSFNANNRNTVESYARILSSYVNWCVQNGYAKDNPLQNLRPDDFTKYLSDDDVYFTEKQLRRWESYLENYQDSVILRLLFIGVGGKQLSEIRNLRKEDVDRENRVLKLRNTLKFDEETGLPLKYTERYLEVEDEYIFDLIDGALNIHKYMKRNGEVKDGAEARSIGMLDLVDNGYVVRSSITKTENYDYPVDKFVIYRRISMIAEIFGINEFTTKLIQRSGMLYYASKIMGEELTLDDMKMVADRFNIKSYHNLKGFLTTDKVNSIYS